MEGLFSSSNPFKRQPQAEVTPPEPRVQPSKKIEEPKREKRKRREELAEEDDVAEEELAEDDDIAEELAEDDIIEAELAGAVSSGEEELAEDASGEEGPNAASSKFDSEEKLRRTIFVGNLPLKIKKKAMIREFATYGAVKSARLRSVPVGTIDLPRKAALSTGQINESRSSMNAYIVFEDEASAKAALGHNMKLVGDKHIRVDSARPPCRATKSRAQVVYDKNRTVFLGNVPFDVEEEELVTLFPADQVEAVRVVRDQRTNIGKGFAFVSFKSPDGARRSLAKGALEVHGRTLRVSRIKQEGVKQGAKYSRPPNGRRNSYEGTRAGKKQRLAGKNERGHQSKPRDAQKQGTKKKRPAVAARKAAQTRAKQGG